MVMNYSRATNYIFPGNEQLNDFCLYYSMFSIIFYMFSVFPAVLSMILMVIIRYISRVLVWIVTILVILGSLGKLFVYFCGTNSTVTNGNVKKKIKFLFPYIFSLKSVLRFYNYILLHHFTAVSI